MYAQKPTNIEKEMMQLWRTYGSDYIFILKRLAKHNVQTFTHSIRAGYFCFLLGKMLGLTEAENITLLKSVYLHDVGKLTVPQTILNKTGPLNEEEWQIVRSHCTNGLQIIQDGQYEAFDRDIILYHHENLDGTGYYGLTEQQLTLPVRIIRVVDSFDAMTYSRGYNEVKNINEAFEELYRWDNIIYDTNVVYAFHNLITQQYNPSQGRSTHESKKKFKGKMHS